jgi:hypothetical protein
MMKPFHSSRRMRAAYRQATNVKQANRAARQRLPQSELQLRSALNREAKRGFTTGDGPQLRKQAPEPPR